MEHFITKTELMLNGLSAHLTHIDEITTSLRLLNAQARRYKEFYQEVSFFVHYIIKNDDLNKLFLELINYNDKLNKNGSYVKLLDDINNNVRLIAASVLSHSDFDKLVLEGADFGTPFLTPMILKIEPLLKALENYDVNSSKEDDFLIRTYGILENILNRLGAVGETDMGPIIDKLNLFHFQINNFDYFRTYEHAYLGVASAERIATIYSSINPNLVYGGDTFRNLQNDLIQNGKGVFEPETMNVLTADCHKVFQYLHEKLNTQLSIELYIDRFITYISLYYENDLTPNLAEKELQGKFEEFIFNAGYYPISEAQLKNGRLDTIAVDQSNAFLFEFKQVDLGKTEEDDVQGKLRGAQIQSSIYLDSLKPFPRLNNNVFILVFTNRKVTFKNAVDRIVKNGVTFIAKAISIYDKTASLAKTECEIDLSEFIV